MGAKFSIQNTHTQNMKFHDFETNVFNTTLKNVPKQAFQDNSKKKKIFQPRGSDSTLTKQIIINIFQKYD